MIEAERPEILLKASRNRRIQLEEEDLAQSLLTKRPRQVSTFRLACPAPMQPCSPPSAGDGAAGDDRQDGDDDDEAADVAATAHAELLALQS